MASIFGMLEAFCHVWLRRKMWNEDKAAWLEQPLEEPLLGPTMMNQDKASWASMLYKIATTACLGPKMMNKG